MAVATAVWVSTGMLAHGTCAAFPAAKSASRISAYVLSTTAGSMPSESRTRCA
jgi:hypothetical protein